MLREINTHTAEAEQQCIRMAQEIRLDSIRAELKELYIWSAEFLWPREEMKLDITWSPSVIGKVLQVVMIPFVYLVILAWMILTPFIYLIGVWELIKKRRKLTKMAHKLEGSLAGPFDVQEEKTLRALWSCYGLGQKNFTEREQIKLLSRWIEILYGEAAMQMYDLKQIFDEIRQRQFAANTAYNKGDPEAPHFFFGDPASSLVMKVSAGLPPYQCDKR